MTCEYTIHRVCDIRQNCITIKKPINYSRDFMVFDVFYKDKFFLLKMDGIHLTHSSFTTKTFSANHLEKFFDLKNIIVDKLTKNKRYASCFSEKIPSDKICQSHIKITNMSLIDTLIFDTNGANIGFERIKPMDKLSIVLYIQSIWTNQTHFGLKCSICQILRSEPFGITKNMFTAGPYSVVPRLIPPPPPPTPTRSKTIVEITPVVGTVVGPVVRPSLSELLNSIKLLKPTNQSAKFLTK
jgi:hypothetical protein